MSASYLHKLDRAKAHLDVLERTEGGQELEAGIVLTEYDPKGSSNIVRVGDLDVLGCIVGDCAHNLRSCLDHIILEIAVKNLPPGGLPSQFEEHSEFPIFWDTTLYASKRERRIGPLPTGAQTIIDDLQPHRAGTNYPSHELYRIHQLDIVDKHRTLHVLRIRPDGLRVGGVNIQFKGIQLTNGGQDMESGTEVLAYTTPQGEMDVKPHLTGKIHFGQSSPFPGEPVIDVLKALINYVEQQVITPLKPYL